MCFDFNWINFCPFPSHIAPAHSFRICFFSSLYFDFGFFISSLRRIDCQYRLLEPIPSRFVKGAQNPICLCKMCVAFFASANISAFNVNYRWYQHNGWPNSNELNIYLSFQCASWVVDKICQPQTFESIFTHLLNVSCVKMEIFLNETHVARCVSAYVFCRANDNYFHLINWKPVI